MVESCIALLALTSMEIVLGIDNIVFIAILTSRLPLAQQASARRIGLALAMGTRILLLLTLSWILRLTQPLVDLEFLDGILEAAGAAEESRREMLQVSLRDLIMIVGGLFLVGKSTLEIHHKIEGQQEGEGGRKEARFASVIIQIAILDIVFSLDSVITAVGMAKDIWVMILAVVLAVGVMLVFAGRVSAFVERHPTVKMLALSFLILIGVMLMAEGIGTHIEKGYIYFAMAFSLGVEFLNIVARGRSARRTAAVIALGCCLANGANSVAIAADDARLPALDLGGVVEKHVMIPMRDGVRLSAYLYFPPGEGPWPVLYEQRYASLTAAGTRQSNAKLAAAGYVVCGENFRGSQQSEGDWVGYRALGWGKLQDGYDTVEWLATQPWSTGKVGTFGSSQAGFAQNFLAVTRPPHLVCQYMIDTGLSLFHEGYRIGGATRPERFKQMDQVCRVPEHNRRLMDEWFSHPHYDAYWADEDCSKHFDRMDVPCFTVGSWYDFMCIGSIDSYVARQHRGGPNSRGKQQLLIGPWLHGRFKETNKTAEMVYPENAKFAMDAHMIRWFDHYLKGVDNGVERDSTVRYYVMGAVGEPAAPGNEWRSAKDWPIAAMATPYYLRADKTLRLDAPAGKAEGEAFTEFLADPLHPNEIPTRAFPGAADARAFEAQAEVRTFTTPPLAEPVEWTGLVEADMYVSSTAKDTDLIVRVSDVYPDGRSILIIDYVRRLRYRKGYEREELLEPGRIERVRFNVGWLSQIFARGHRIRVTVASTGAPFYEPNPNTGTPLTIDFPADAVVAKNRVYHQGTQASRIIAPLVTAGEQNAR